MIHINSFARRHTAESDFSHFDGADEVLIERVERNMAQGGFVNGYREGVIVVGLIDTSGFFSSVVTLREGDKLVGEFKPRRDGEKPRKTLKAIGRGKQPALCVDIVLYASTVLAEDGDNELPAEEGNWEIISINAAPGPDALPIHPEVLMHNHFGSDGGTSTGMSDSEFVTLLRESFVAWRDKAQSTPGK